MFKTLPTNLLIWSIKNVSLWIYPRVENLYILSFPINNSLSTQTCQTTEIQSEFIRRNAKAVSGWVMVFLWPPPPLFAKISFWFA